MMIKTLNSQNTQQWDDFVNQSADGTFFHLSAWKQVIEQAFGHDCYYFYTETDGKMTGLLALTHINSRLFGNSLISNAFCVYGGVLTNDEKVRAELDKKACQLAEELGVDALEMRNRVQQNPERPYKELYVTFRKELDEGVEKNMLAIPRKQRAMVRKGIKAGLVSVIDNDIERLYQAYSESVRNLGTPVFPKKYFKLLKEIFKEQCEVLTIEKDGQLIASVMNFYYKDEVLPYYGGGTEYARAVKGNDFMYWEVMRRAVEKGIKVFDYGRSKMGTGSYSFKKNWGFEPKPLFYEFHLVKATELPDINPLNPKYQIFIKTWKKLPLGLSQFIGPFLSKDLG